MQLSSSRWWVSSLKCTSPKLWSFRVVCIPLLTVLPHQRYTCAVDARVLECARVALNCEQKASLVLSSCLYMGTPTAWTSTSTLDNPLVLRTLALLEVWRSTCACVCCRCWFIGWRQTRCLQSVYAWARRLLAFHQILRATHAGAGGWGVQDQQRVQMLGLWDGCHPGQGWALTPETGCNSFGSNTCCLVGPIPATYIDTMMIGYDDKATI